MRGGTEDGQSPTPWPLRHGTRIPNFMEVLGMLILSRKKSEKITIFTDPPVVLLIADIDRGKVRVGVKARRDIAIVRDEVMTQEQREVLKGEEPRPAA